MRVVLTATMAASVLAIGLAIPNMPPARALALPGAKAHAAVQLAQQKEMTPAPGPDMSPGMGPGMGGMGGQGQSSPGGPGQGTQGTPSQGQPSAAGPGPGGRMLHGERGYGPRMGERGRVWVGPERGRGHMRHHYGRRGWEAGPGYGYMAHCGWLRRRAIETGSRYWWRRYRHCVH
jgi:hypothetical protein